MSNEVTQTAEESQPTETTAAEPTTAAPETEAAPTQETPAADANTVASESASPVETAPAEQATAPEAPQQSETPEPPPPPVRTEPRRVMKPANMPPPPAPPQAQAPAPRPAPVAAAAAQESQETADIDFGAILEQFESEQTMFHPGELVTGTVVGINDRGALVDFGYKSEGAVPLEELTDENGQLTVKQGDEIEVVIRSIYSGDGAPQLSRTEALGRKVWDRIEEAYREEKPIVGKIVDKTKGGLKIDIDGVEAFLPGSQIDSRPIRQLDSYIGEEIEAKVIKFSRRRSNIVLSRKVITDEVVNAQKAETLSKLEVGYVVDGTVKNLTEYGAFVDIGGIDGLLHVTDMSWGRIHHPSEMFKTGEHIQVKVLKLDREKEKISLGYKQLQPDPWSTVIEVYPVNSKVHGKVSSVTDYGVFVELEPGVEGLVHVSEISWSRRAQSPKKLFHRGQDIEVQVLGVDTVEKRISLGMKQFQENPWDTVDLRFPVGARVHGRVRNITDFGAFIELEEGIDGLVHVSDISWGKKIKHPKDVLKKDQEVDAIVTNVDKRNQRLSLSMKDLTPSAWESFVATHKAGDVVRGKVTRFTNFGVFVELGEGFEGLCHISELSDERVEKPEDVAQIGQEMDFKILRIEPADQKIGLSHRAVGKNEEPVSDTSSSSRMFSSEAKGGMASLGELANLKLGSAAPEPEPAPAEPSKKQKRAEKAEAASESPATETSEPATAETGETAESAPAEEQLTSAEATSAEPSETPAESPAESAPAAAEEPTAEDAAPAAEAPEQPTEQASNNDAPATETTASEEAKTDSESA